MEYLIGGLLGATTAVLAGALGFARDRSFFPTILIIIATYYVLFAAMGSSGQALWKESVIGLGFAVVAVLGFRTDLWWVAAALAGHGVFDFFHHHLVDNPAVPDWWPGFCLSFDIALGLALAIRLVSRSKVMDLDAVGTIQLLGSVAMDSLRVTAGVESYPRLGDRVYAAPHNFVADLPSLMEPEGNPKSTVLLKLGSIDVALESAVSVRPEKLFGRHCAILGTTGGGKSWTTARIIEECLKFKAKIILLDATGEYRGFSGAFAEHVHLGSPVNTAADSQPRSLPPTCFVESDFIALFEPAGKVQGPKMRAAMRSLRLAKLVPAVATNGIIKKIDQSKLPIIEAEQKAGVAAKLDDPRQEFDVAKLSAQIEQECVYPDGFGVGKGVKDTTKWGGDSGEVSYCLSLMSRISAVLTSPSFSCVFNSTDPALTAAIDDFVVSDKRLLRICLSGVAYEFKAREIVANVIGRYLLNKARGGAFSVSPVVVIVDEAHNFLGRQIGGEDSVARLDAFELIAKEGRKFGLNICLTTQRPRDITEGVLSQMGTLVVHRLTNDRDREVVERACGEIDRSASSFLPNLKPGEAAIIGADFPIPLTIQIFSPEAQPKSDGPNYQKCWQIDPPAP